LVNVDDNKAVVVRLVETINTRALDHMAELVARDVVDHNAVIFMQPEGPGGVEEGVRMLLVAFPDLRIDVHDLIGEEETVAATMTVSGTNLGEYRGLPQPTNQRFEMEAVAIFRLEDGKVAEIHGTADRLGMLVQLGILPDIG
jgi:steroid delta-isomerase-like uncharacterized protein